MICNYPTGEINISEKYSERNSSFKIENAERGLLKKTGTVSLQSQRMK
jgi:hypothetical protein